MVHRRRGCPELMQASLLSWMQPGTGNKMQGALESVLTSVGPEPVKAPRVAVAISKQAQVVRCTHVLGCARTGLQAPAPIRDSIGSVQ